MPKIRMLETTPGSLDGVSVTSFVAGREYDVPESLATAFVNHMGVAVVVRERKVVEVPEKAVEVAAPENKEESIRENVFGSSEKEVLTEEEAEAESGETVEDGKAAMRVFQLADELGVSSKKIIKAAKKLGIDVTAPASGLTEAAAEKIKAEIK